MRTSQLLLATLKETPSDAEVISHKLMLRAGMIRKSAAGIYTWMPLGFRVLNKVVAIVREEMDRAGALEMLMPSVQPAELWQETERWDQFGPQLLKLKDRHDRDFCYGPTHEEVISDIMRRELRSYKQLPINFYQIQTKFRDEIRPRFGVMRAREFLMKDAYSFHITEESLAQTYQTMFDAYCRVFDRLKLNYRPVLADTGSIGGSLSHEFHVLAQSGEDQIFYSDESDYAANLEFAEAVAVDTNQSASGEAMKTVDTPNAKTINDVSEQLKVDKKKTVKTLLVKGADVPLVALVLRGDHTLNKIKSEKHALLKTPLTMATDEDVKNVAGCDYGSFGPVGLSIPIIVDRSAEVITDFICGANENDKHFINVNWKQDCPKYEVADLRNVEEGDPSPDGKGGLKMARGIEVGHVFQLGSKYSEAMHATVLDENGKDRVMQMGCYGLGVSRVVAASIEQNHDENGIIWPDSIAPYQVALVPINMHKSKGLQEKAEALYEELTAAGFEVLFDDRAERPGYMFAELDLIGIPHRIVIGERGLEQGEVEYKGRRDSEAQNIKRDEVLNFLIRHTAA